MTGKELYRRAVALLGQESKDVTYYEDIALEAINQLLADYLWEHNAMCYALGQTAYYPVSPELLELEEEIPYNERLVRECFPYGLAALLVADEDREEYNRLMDALEERIVKYQPCCETQIRGMEE